MTWIQTYTGLAVDLIEPDPNTIILEDIAHALSRKRLLLSPKWWRVVYE